MAVHFNGTTSLVPDHTEVGNDGDGSEIELEGIKLAQAFFPNLDNVNKLEKDLTVGTGGVLTDVGEQAPTGECHANTVRNTITVAPGALHRTVFVPSLGGNKKGITVNSVAKNVIVNGVSVNSMGGANVQRIADEYAQQDLASQRERLRPTTPQESTRAELTQPPVSTSVDLKEAAPGWVIPSNQSVVSGQPCLPVGVTCPSEHSALLEVSKISDENKSRVQPGVGPTTQAQPDDKTNTGEAPENAGCCARMTTCLSGIFRGIFSGVHNLTFCECCNINNNLDVSGAKLS